MRQIAGRAPGSRLPIVGGPAACESALDLPEVVYVLQESTAPGLERLDADVVVLQRLWLARYNKQVFGSLFAAGLLFTLACRQGWIG